MVGYFCFTTEVLFVELVVISSAARVATNPCKTKSRIFKFVFIALPWILWRRWYVGGGEGMAFSALSSSPSD